MRFSLVFLLAACNDDICTRQTDCAANQTCSTNGRCVSAMVAPDGGPADSVGDAAAPDAPDAPDALDGGMP